MKIKGGGIRYGLRPARIPPPLVVWSAALATSKTSWPVPHVTSSSVKTTGEIGRDSGSKPPCKNERNRAFLLLSSNPRNEWPKWRHYAENGWRLSAEN